MSNSDQKKASKFMSLVLRHAPPEVGILPDRNGWVSIDALVGASDGLLNEASLREVVAQSDKQRFSISGDGMSVRANQGHSIRVDLGLVPESPPDTLYHGTAHANLPLIREEGLSRMSRQHVHLSPDVETAKKIGQRHGVPAVICVAANRMTKDGHNFFRSENGVWLTDKVPLNYLTFPN